VLRVIENDERHALGIQDAFGPQSSEPIVPAVEHRDFEGTLLPGDHPRWVRDALSVSSRAKEIAARLKPVAVRILGFWDHRVRSVMIGGLRIGVDASGSYRIH
jgi:hypothetical protein